MGIKPPTPPVFRPVQGRGTVPGNQTVISAAQLNDQFDQLWTETIQLHIELLERNGQYANEGADWAKRYDHWPDRAMQQLLSSLMAEPRTPAIRRQIEIVETVLVTRKMME